ncbi:undecaprenyldiphospho-muramoylpentapeptide beta-N-acetylglucosaminyltransferase [Kitasatospora sp. NPDC053057]|uniref:undecaprenyldiphospho-muramoylpentapeptide beta-N-acetylglucosaminyltransferase n=1 Tax=Kitasatospora sp. NPDC053057 TaxID=3364062 RepID=UPI0037C56839
MHTPLSVVIGAGGTGGHIYPGLALAEALRKTDPDAVISFVGTTRGLETRLIPEAGYRLHTVDMIPFDPSLGARRYLLPADLVRAAKQAQRALADQRAQVVVGMGGYASAPAVLAARMAGLPSLIHESNAVPGRANAFAARLTAHIALAFDETRAHLPKSRRSGAVTVGMPLTGAVAHLDRRAKSAEARRRLGVPEAARLVLFNGGSLGAQRLTEAAIGLAEQWRDRADVRLLIKTGPQSLDSTRHRLARSGGDAVAEAVPYLDRMDLAYAASDVVVCRAGAATVAELATVRVPAVLVPYPHAPGDHQFHNAKVLADAGAARILRDADTDANSLAAVLDPLLAEPSRLAAMSLAAAGGTHAQAADLLADRVRRLAGRSLDPNPTITEMELAE